MKRLQSSLRKLNSNSIRSFLSQALKQLVTNWQIILLPFGIVFTVFLVIFIFRYRLPFSVTALTTDPMETANLRFYFGIFSNLGVLLMASASALNFLGASILGSQNRHFQFLIFSGFFCLAFALDDLFIFHDRVLPQHLHVPEVLAYGSYFLFIIVYLVYFARVIYGQTNFTLMIFALAALGASVINIFFDFAFAKDGAKFLGIIYLFIYYFDAVKKFIKNGLQR